MGQKAREKEFKSGARLVDRMEKLSHVMWLTNTPATHTHTHKEV